LTYLHSDHLGSTVLSTLSSNAFEVGQGYYGYGQYRSGGSLPTDHRYTACPEFIEGARSWTPPAG
jgi:hypothetical protein